MDIETILLRILLITVFSGIVGFERELNQSHAGLKTHILVGITAALIALIQQRIILQVIDLQIQYPMLNGEIKSDPARLIAQVVSGVGFLGGGAIIVTKKNVSGITTAASIWSVAGLGLSIGMGYYDLGVVGFSFIFAVLLFTKIFKKFNYLCKLRIEYVGGEHTLDQISYLLESQCSQLEHLDFNVRFFGGEKIYVSTFEIKGNKDFSFHNTTTELARLEKVISIQKSNIS